MLLAQNMLMWLIPRHIQKEPMALHSREDQACQAAAEPVEGVQTRVEVDAHWTQCQEGRPCWGTVHSA